MTTEREIYEHIRKTIPGFPVGLNPFVAMKMMKDAKKELDQRPKLTVITNADRKP